MSWLRAILTAAIAVGLAFVALVIVPDLVLSQINSIARGQRVALATGWFTVALVAIWLLAPLRRSRPA